MPTTLISLCILLAGLCGSLPVLAGPPSLSRLRVEGRSLVDANGGVVLLRGVNLSGESKVPPFRHVRAPADLDPLPRLGLNALRLLFIWEAYEPSPGVYDERYLDQLAAVIDEAEKRGVYVIVDIHQDAFSRFATSGCGDGFPAWAIAKSARRQVPDNGPACASWGGKMIVDLDMHRSFADFYADRDGVRSRYLALLGRLARRFAGRTVVAGYDLLNEPWGDENREILPLYRDAARVLRAVDPDAILFLEPHALCSGGFLGSAMAKPALTNVVYAPHYYDPGVLLGKSYSGLRLGPALAFRHMLGKAQDWGVPLLLGEFGAPAGTVRGREYLDLLHTKLNDSGASSTQWNYTPGWTAANKDGWNSEDLSITDGSGRLRPEVFAIRPQVVRLAGLRFSIRTVESTATAPRALTVRWLHDPSRGETSLFAPPALFDGGRALVETSGGDLTCVADPTGLRTLCTAPSAGERTVTIRGCRVVAGVCL